MSEDEYKPSGTESEESCSSGVDEDADEPSPSENEEEEEELKVRAGKCMTINVCLNFYYVGFVLFFFIVLKRLWIL